MQRNHKDTIADSTVIERDIVFGYYRSVAPGVELFVSSVIGVVVRAFHMDTLYVLRDFHRIFYSVYDFDYLVTWL